MVHGVLLVENRYLLLRRDDGDGGDDHDVHDDHGVHDVHNLPQIESSVEWMPQLVHLEEPLRTF